MEDKKVDKPETQEPIPPPAAALGGPADVPGTPLATPPALEPVTPVEEVPTVPPAPEAEGATVPPAPADQAAAAAPTEEAPTASGTEALPAPADDTVVVAPGAATPEGAAAAAVAERAVPPAARPRPTRAPIDPTGRGGTASILAGVAIIAPVLIRELTRGTEPYLLLPVTLILVAVALGGLRVAQSGKDGKLGRIGFLLASVGALVLVLMLIIVAYNDFVLNTRLQSGYTLMDLGFYALVAGVVLFGIASLNAGVLARGPMLLLFIALPIGLALDAMGAFAGNRRFPWGPGLTLGAGVHLGLKVMGLALIWMGYSILKTTKDRTTARAQAGAG